ncbi:uncharacterized protein MYCFIDRAFT_191153 [Pseudocercospora fijiensis CIRAD86]|uniref:SGNH hydrolase-type esterase domain-containing protein n=1 Tax=Pseudocercospora fijiensis (strain CIRAD86) TaxID=383855 RepID=M3AJZ4_PSEFD|nr:uncharacterized protein MYCFIDRAFT_191153 [Pseudocercospora fijiensis CIRAD86]EME77757.1 hypothetical protein MYCFIDRAFT_191153 [Pseudocercospora fijiensis CIRAD86]
MLLKTSLSLLWLPLLASATIWQNGQIRPNDYPDTTISLDSYGNEIEWHRYGPDSPELSYKGRWDDRYISWWSAPGLKFGFKADNVAITFGNYTSHGVLIAYRLDGQDWMLTNVTANSTHLLITPSTTGWNLTTSKEGLRTFELRVTNWAYGVQIDCIHLSGPQNTLVKLPDYTRRIEVIGDSLSAGSGTTLEGISSWSWGVAYGLGDTEFSLTAYPGICVTDTNCWGNPRGQVHQWRKTCDTSGRAVEMYGPNLTHAPDWDFSKHPHPDLTIINIGTNDNNTHNNVTSEQYTSSYIKLLTDIHATYPHTKIIILSLWSGWGPVGSTWIQGSGFYNEIQEVVKHFNNGSLNKMGEVEGAFLFYYNTTGIMQHNDNSPIYHPTDVGAIKVASHLMEYIRLVFGWEFRATGPEVQSGTLYWNDMTQY